MLQAYATGVAVLVSLMLVWLAVQCGWRRVFPGAFADPDVLAERSGCRGCRCTGVCQSRRDRGDDEEELE